MLESADAKSSKKTWFSQTQIASVQVTIKITVYKNSDNELGDIINIFPVSPFLHSVFISSHIVGRETKIK